MPPVADKSTGGILNSMNRQIILLDQMIFSTMKYLKIGFAGSILCILLVGIIYRYTLCDSLLGEELLHVALAILISGAMLAFVKHSGIITMYFEERNSLPLIVVGGGLACLIMEGSMPDAILILFSLSTAQPIYHAGNREIHGIWDSLSPAVMATILCRAVRYSGNILLFIWIPVSVTVLCACLSGWCSPRRGRDAAVCIGLLALFTGVVLAISVRTGAFEIEIAALLRCLNPEKNPLRSGFPLLAARETIRTSPAVGTNDQLSTEVWSFWEQQDTRMWQLTHMVARWGYISGLLVLILSAVFILLGIQLCRNKAPWDRWPSVIAWAILFSHTLFYLLQSTGWTIWYVEYFPFFSASVSWNAIFLFLVGLILMDRKVTNPPLKLLYGSSKNERPRRRAG